MSAPDAALDLGETIRGLRAQQEVFGRYVLRKRIGRGGMGEVWMAEDRGLERQVALKFLPEIVAYDRTAVDDLKRETRRALTLTHPNIVRTYDFLSGSALAAISMELVEGETLARLRLGRPEKVMGAGELSPLLVQLCDALDYAHVMARIVHRDLKPANLLVTGAGVLKVADFGIAATITESTARVSRAPGASGTPLYMSPQQLMGAPPAVTDDIYSLGATLYELLTGTPPFHAGDIVAQVQGKVPPGVRARWAELGLGGVNAVAMPECWEQTIAACLAKDPAARPQSAVEVAERLALAGGGASLSAPRGDGNATQAETVVLPTASRGRGGRAALLAGEVVGLFVVLGAAYHFRGRAWTQSNPAIEPAPPAVVDAPKPGRKWEIADLGMKFVPVPGTNVLCSVWETRVRDFAVFVEATGHDATLGMQSVSLGSYGVHGGTWKSPGYLQGPTYPVVGMNDDDAKAFCGWLTRRERVAGRLAQGQAYRLPTDAEWTAAAGQSQFPWGDEWQPPSNAGNFYDKSDSAGGGKDYLAGYDDGFDDAAPVGLFTANALGIHDLAGNVQERVGERPGGLRGSSCSTNRREDFATLARDNDRRRSCRIGFRVVCDLGAAAGERPATRPRRADQRQPAGP